ncbi:hypothetical protein OU798_23660 [Prolixibacteraceae bacterium Z1-6]|uniref:Uncharacterized protein n=1 Tax=Draconibacterium aestuarii TaxID=2998507 RepID=A0A9X3FIM0_9BACT|nr:hypothetical protein [Prolixibacteraceae bacterium Z1-6]
MFRKLKSNTDSDFRTEIPQYSDEKIVDILKKRDYYQPEATKLAIEVAIKRGIIFSEQDLFSDEYNVEELDRSLFPKIHDPKIQKRIRKSIARSLVICGIMPIVFGLLQSNKGNKVEGSLILLFGVLWIFVSAQLIKNYHKTFVIMLLAGAFLSLVYIVTKLILLHRFIFMDFFIASILFLLIAYGLLFIKNISKK